MGVNRWAQGAESLHNLEWGTLMQIDPRIVRKYRPEFTKT